MTTPDLPELPEALRAKVREALVDGLRCFSGSMCDTHAPGSGVSSAAHHYHCPASLRDDLRPAVEILLREVNADWRRLRDLEDLYEACCKPQDCGYAPCEEIHALRRKLGLEE